MKRTITLLLVLFTSVCTFGQNIDWANAPLNPVPVFYTANHYNLKGPIKEFKGESMTGESLYLQFNEQRKLVLKIVQGLEGTSKLKYIYQYDIKGNLICQISSMLDKNGNASYESKADIKVDSKGLVTQLGGFTYSYDKKNRLVLCTAKDQNGKENYRQEFTYNNLGQVTSEKITDPHAATGVMEVEEFKFAYTKRNTGGWNITMHVYKEGKLATKGDIPLITSSFVRQKREQIFNNPQNFSFDEIGLEAYKPDYVKVMIDQHNNLRGKFLIKMNKDSYPVNITYYNNELSIPKYKETTASNTTLEGSVLGSFDDKKPLSFQKISNAQVQFYQDGTKIIPPDQFFISKSGDLIAFYEPRFYFIFPDAKNVALNTTVTPKYKFGNDFFYEVLSSSEVYVNRKGKYLNAQDYKFYMGANGVLNFMFPEADITYISNMENGPLYEKYYGGGKFDGTDYLDIKKDKSFDFIRHGIRIPKSDYEVKVDAQNDNKAYIFYKGKKEFEITHYRTFFEQAYLRSVLRIQ